MKLKALATIAAGIMVAATLNAGIAQAAPTPGVLPASDSIYAVNCEPNSNANGFGTINATTLEFTNFGSTDCTASNFISKDDPNSQNPATHPPMYRQGAWNAVESKFYLLDTMNSSLDILSVDGARTVKGHILGLDNSDPVSIAIQPSTGKLFVFSNNGTLFTLTDFDTMTAVKVGVDGPGNGEEGGPAAAFAPNGDLYLKPWGESSLFKVDPTTGERTVAVENFNSYFGGNNIGTLNFDSNGTLWATVYGSTNEIWSADPANIANTAQIVSGTHPNGLVTGGVWGRSPEVQMYFEALLIRTPATPKVVAPINSSATFPKSKAKLTSKIKATLKKLAAKIKTSSATAGKKPTVTITYYVGKPVKAAYKKNQLALANLVKKQLGTLKVKALKFVLKFKPFYKVKKASAGRVDINVKY